MLPSLKTLTTTRVENTDEECARTNESMNVPLRTAAAAEREGKN